MAFILRSSRSFRSFLISFSISSERLINHQTPINLATVLSFSAIYWSLDIEQLDVVANALRARTIIDISEDFIHRRRDTSATPHECTRSSKSPWKQLWQRKSIRQSTTASSAQFSVLIEKLLRWRRILQSEGVKVLIAQCKAKKRCNIFWRA